MEGVTIVARMLDRLWDREFVVYYDPDPDGIFSGHAVHEFLTRFSKEHTVYINRNRGHGILFDEKPYKGALVINVDSGVSYDRLKELVDNGVNVISLDHHELEGSPEISDNLLSNLTSTERELVHKGLLYYRNEELGTEGVVLNNQYEFEDENYRFMSGCGVVLTVLNQLDPSFFEEEQIAWHGITLLSDSRDIENPIAFEILKKTYETDIESTRTIKHITDEIGFNKFEMGENTLDRAYIDFYLSPYINALLRLNKGYQTIKWFSGGELGVKKVKEQQNEILKTIKERVVSAELDNILIINVEKFDFDQFEISNYIGLLANKLLVKGKTVVITATHHQEFIRGSVRGYHSSIDYQKIFKEQGLIALGHKGAFGLKSYKTDYDYWLNLDKIIGEANKHAEQTYTIHKIDNLALNRKHLRELAYQNQFLRPFYKHYVKYTGFKHSKQKDGETYQEYSINGIPVKCFDQEVNLTNGFILPSMSKGYLSLYLERIVI